MKLPSEDQCLEYFNQYKVPDNIRVHCLKVGQVATFLAWELKKAGVNVNIDLTRSTALLHDLFKMSVLMDSFANLFHPEATITAEQKEFWKEFSKKFEGMNEAQIAKVVFSEEFPKLAQTLENVSTHKIDDKTWEEKIVHYADWRVFKNEVVNLNERFEYLKKRYAPGGLELWTKRLNEMKKIEKEIFKLLPYNSKDLKDKLE